MRVTRWPGSSGLQPYTLYCIAKKRKEHKNFGLFNKKILNCGLLNVRGCGQSEKKRMIADIFKERKFDIFALCETKVKGQGVEDWDGQRVIVSGVSERCRAREGVGLIIANRLWGRVKDYKCVSSRIVWVKLNVRGEKLVVVSAYGPGMERSESEREQFWESLNVCLAGFNENERVIVLGDLNAKVGDRERGEVVGKFGVPGVNENGECLIELCEERCMIVGNTWFEKKLINKYTWERENGKDRSLLDYILVQNKWKRSLIDVTVRRGVAAGISDHYLVEGRIRMNGSFWGEWKSGSNLRVVKNHMFEKKEVREEYKKKMDEEWAKVKGKEYIGVDREYESFRNAVIGTSGSVCGYKSVGRKNKRSDWWDEEMRDLVKEKRRLFETHLQSRRDVDREAYNNKKRDVKRKVREKQKRADEMYGEKLSRNFRENKKLFWRDVNSVRKVRDQMDMRIKDVNGNILSDESEVKNRWSGYFQELLNVDNGREAELTDAGVQRVNVNLRLLMEVSVDDVRKAVKKLKNGKSPGIDGVTSEMLRYGGESIIEWLTRVCVVCLAEGRVPVEWKRAIVLPIYKGKGDRNECKNYRGISLLSIPGKVYGRVLIEKVRSITEGLIGEEQCGFRRGRGCVDQIFTMRQLSEKFVSKGKSLYVAYMDLEKAYDRIDREAMWRVLSMYGVNDDLIRGIRSFYEGSEACVRVCRQESDWFSVRVGLRQGCVMSPWLFNVYMDGVMREVRERTDDIGVSLWDKDRNCEWQAEWMMFADDTVLVGDSEEKLQRLVKEFGDACKRRKLTVNVNKSKVMRIDSKNEGDVSVSMNDARMEVVDSYRYLGVNISKDGKMNEEVNNRIGDARKAAGALQKVWKKRKLSQEAKVGMYEAIVEPSLLYGSEAWVLNGHERKRMEAVEMNCLRSICGVRRLDRVRNEEIRRRCSKEVSVCEKVDQSVLRWFGHVERMEEERLVKRVYQSDVMGVRRRGRPRRGWMDGVKEILGRKGLSIEDARECVQDRCEWRSICRGDRRAAGETPA